MAQAVEVLTVLAGLPPVANVSDLAAALGATAADLGPLVDALCRKGLLERWSDPARPGNPRLMLSALSLAELGLALSAQGDRWVTLAAYPAGMRG